MEHIKSEINERNTSKPEGRSSMKAGFSQSSSVRMRAGIYLRVSTDMQARDGESLAEQEATCQAYCNFRNIPIINIYREEGRSGKDTNRPQFQKMIRDCKLGATCCFSLI